VVENRGLARSLYRTVDLDRPVPESLYAQVARILTWVTRRARPAGRGELIVFGALRKIAGRHADLVLVVLMICILVVLFTPIPRSCSISSSWPISPSRCSCFCSRSTWRNGRVSRLSVAAADRDAVQAIAQHRRHQRLIFTNADAGKVIAAMGSYVVGGNYIVGLIVFVYWSSSQYVVVTTARSAWPRSPPGSRWTACPVSR